MKLIAVNGHPQMQQPWRGAMVVQGRAQSGGALVDPTGTVSARLLVEPDLRRRYGLDRPSLPVLLTRAAPDQIAALIELRHGNPIDLYTTPALFESLGSMSTIWAALQERSRLHWRMVPLGGDLSEAHFHVEGQVGVAYTAWMPGGDEGAPGAPLVLIIEDESSEQQVAWVHGAGADLAMVSAHLQSKRMPLQWLVLDAEGLEDRSVVNWLAAQPAVHRLMLGGSPLVQRHASKLGIECAHDGLEIVVG